MSLSERVAFVTGASQGIGRACALKLATTGAAVAVAARNQEKLNELVNEIAASGGKAAAFVVDVSDEEQVKSAIKAAIAHFGKIDILVNNAGITRDNLFMRMKDEEWDQVIQVNLTAAFRLSRAVLRGMMKKRWGRIVQITSIVGATGNPGQGNYAAAKAGLIGMTKSLAAEVASRNITVNAVAPGFIQTAMTDALTDQQKDAIATRIPLARMGKAEEIAAAVVYLASEEAAYVTGETIHINGGMAML